MNATARIQAPITAARIRNAKKLEYAVCAVHESFSLLKSEPADVIADHVFNAVFDCYVQFFEAEPPTREDRAFMLKLTALQFKDLMQYMTKSFLEQSAIKWKVPYIFKHAILSDRMSTDRQLTTLSKPGSTPNVLPD